MGNHQIDGNYVRVYLSSHPKNFAIFIFHETAILNFNKIKIDNLKKIVKNVFLLIFKNIKIAELYVFAAFVIFLIMENLHTITK